jgi:hypothetical protein
MTDLRLLTALSLIPELEPMDKKMKRGPSGPFIGILFGLLFYLFFIPANPGIIWDSIGRAQGEVYRMLGCAAAGGMAGAIMSWLIERRGQFSVETFHDLGRNIPAAEHAVR